MTKGEDYRMEVSELWKWAAAIGVSCAISFCGNWITESSNYVTEEDVIKIVNSKNESFQLELKHNYESLRELKTVVENNSKVLNDIRVELGAIREERKLLIKQLSGNVKNTD